MPTLIDSVLGTMRLRKRTSGLGSCAVCGGTVHETEPVARLRGGDLVHRNCATYRVRARRGGGVSRVRGSARRARG
jgi:hypothetical protein